MLHHFARLITVVILFLTLAPASAQDYSGPEPVTINLSATISSPNSMDVDASGRLFIMDSQRGLICFDSQGGIVEKWKDSDEFAWPAACSRIGMNVTTEGTAIMGPGYSTKNVRQVQPGSTMDSVTKLDPHRDSRFAAGADGTYCLFDEQSFNRNGKWEFERKIYAYHSTGALKAVWDTPKMSGVAVGPDGLIYASIEDQKKLIVYTSDGKQVREIDYSFLDQSARSGVRNFSVDRNGDIYFVDPANSFRFVRLDSQGHLLNRIIPIRPKATRYSGGPVCVAVRNGRVYILCNYTSGVEHAEIQVFMPEGQCITKYVSPELVLCEPRMIAVYPDRSYRVISRQEAKRFSASDQLIADPKPHMGSTAIAAGPNGGFYSCGFRSIGPNAAGQAWPALDYINSRGAVQTEFKFFPNITDMGPVIINVTTDPQTGHVWGIDGNSELFEFNTDGTLIKQLPTNPEARSCAQMIPGIAVDPKGYIYFPDYPKHRVFKVDFDGKLIATLGKRGSGPGELLFPQGVAVDADGRLYVADAGNSRIQVWSPDGTVLGTWGKPGSGNGQLDRPFGVTVASNTVWIADTYNDRIHKLPMKEFWDSITKPSAAISAVSVSEGSKTGVKAPVVETSVPAPVESGITAPSKSAFQPRSGVPMKGVVVAGTDDFTDSIYITGFDGAWGVRATLPKGAKALRGKSCEIVGKVKIRNRSANQVTVTSIKALSGSRPMPKPLQVPNIAVGDGMTGLLSDSNYGCLVTTTGMVTKVDEANNKIYIQDGTYPNQEGLTVYYGGLTKPLSVIPKQGQTVMVTGISVSWPGSTNDSVVPGIRVRAQSDIQIAGQ